jgi:hypothetical protein
MMAYRGVEIQIYSLLTSALDVGEWSVSLPGRLTPRKEPRFALIRKLGTPQIRSRHAGNEERLLPLTELEPRIVQDPNGVVLEMR